MRKLATLTLSSMLALALAPSQGHADSAEDLAAGLGGDIRSTTEAHDGLSVEWGKAVGVVDAPFDRVVEVVHDYANYRKFIPHFKKSKVLSRRGPNALVYMEANVVHGTVTLWAQMRIYKRSSSGDTEIIEGRMMDGNMSHFIARWELEPVEDGSRTLVTFRILVDPDLPLPASVFSKENKKSARRTIRALRERVLETRVQLARNP